MEQDENKPYVHQEYPKWVENTDGVKVIVQTEDEELAVTGQEPKPKRGRPAKAV